MTDSKKNIVPPPKRYSSGEVVKHTGISRQTLHVYTTMGLVEPKEISETGRLWFGEEIFEILQRIEDLKKSKTLAEILEIFQEEKSS